MARTTGIEWTDATWNPIRGCSRVSEGCRNCYAEQVANRFCGPGSPYEGVVQIDPATGKGNGKWNGEIRFVEKHLLDPLRWRTPQRIFVNSMSDLFHEKVTDEMLDRIFAVMALCPQHTFQVLTKRPERMLAYLSSGKQAAILDAGSLAIPDVDPRANPGARTRIAWQLQKLVPVSEWGRGNVAWPLPNVWIGVSVENQRAADERIPRLLHAPAAVRFLSVEPMLGAVDLANMSAKALDAVGGWDDETDEDWRYNALTAGDYYWTPDGETSDGPLRGGIDWVICGGESGPGARPMHPDWARSLRDQCVAAGVPFFFKQWGEWAEEAVDDAHWDTQTWLQPSGSFCGKDIVCGDVPMRRIGKKAAGDLLDGKQWHQFPEAAHG